MKSENLNTNKAPFTKGGCPQSGQRDFYKDIENLSVSLCSTSQQRLSLPVTACTPPSLAAALKKGSNNRKTMKDSGISWIREIPENWELKRVKYACKTRNEKYSTKKGKLDYFALENIISWDSKYVETENEYGLEESNLCYKGDVVFGKLRPYLAKTYLVDYDRCCSSEFAIFYDFQGISKYYLYLFTSYGFIQTVDVSTVGVKMPRANIEYIKNLFIPVPPLSEQQAIADFLDEKCAQIDKASNLIEKQINILEDYKKSLITEAVSGKLKTDSMEQPSSQANKIELRAERVEARDNSTGGFNTLTLNKDYSSSVTTPTCQRQATSPQGEALGQHESTSSNNRRPMKDSGISWIGAIPENWNVSKIGYEVESISDIDHYMPDDVDNGYAYLMIGDLKDKTSLIDFTSCKTISKKDFKRLSLKSKTQKGDLIFARYATIGTVCYVDIDKDFLVSYACLTVRPKKDKLDGKYLFYYTKSSVFADEITRYINSNTQGNVGKDSLIKAKIVLPPLSEQKSIADYLDKKCAQIEKAIESKKQQLETIKEYKKSLIFEYVTGKKQIA